MRIDNEKNEFIPMTIKIGVETFDDDFRNLILNKNVTFQSIEELKQYFDSSCLMAGIKGQSKNTIQKDIELLTT